jgi:hypothetical protein
LRAEREVAQLLQRVEAQHARLGHHGNAAGVAFLAAALVAIVGTIVWSFR